MQYGEGEKAFVRLQEEIIRRYSDLSLFAWSRKGGSTSPYLSLLAESPADFENCAGLELACGLHSLPSLVFSITNCGISFAQIRLTSPLGLTYLDLEWNLGFQSGSRVDGDSRESHVYIYLRKVGPSTFVRVTNVDKHLKNGAGDYFGGAMTEHNACILSSAHVISGHRLIDQDISGSSSGSTIVGPQCTRLNRVHVGSSHHDISDGGRTEICRLCQVLRSRDFFATQILLRRLWDWLASR